MLARLLFLVTVVAAITLAALVMVAPFLDVESVPPKWARLQAVFAGDAIVRRTALASAAGLLVTAFVFFRRRGQPNSESPPRA